jgi:small GTP-binding protein
MATPKEYDSIYKVVIIGDTGVGKTATLMRFTDGVFPDSPTSTIGIDSKSRIIGVNGTRIKLNIIDTGGQEKFRDLTSGFFRHSHGIVVMFDVSAKGSFTNVKSWVKSSNDHNCEHVPKLIVGNKLDVKDRAVTTEEAKQVASELGLQYIEVSAKTGENVDNLFINLCKLMVEKFPHKPLEPQPSTVDLHQQPSRNKEKCKC